MAVGYAAPIERTARAPHAVKGMTCDGCARLVRLDSIMVAPDGATLCPVCQAEDDALDPDGRHDGLAGAIRAAFGPPLT